MSRRRCWSLSYSLQLLHVLLSYRGPCGPQIPMGLLQLQVDVLQLLLQHPVALFQLLLFSAGSLLHAEEAVAPCLQLQDDNHDTHTQLGPLGPT